MTPTFGLNDKVLFKMPGIPFFKGTRDQNSLVRPEIIREGKIIKQILTSNGFAYVIEIPEYIEDQQEGVCLDEYYPYTCGKSLGKIFTVFESKILEKIN